MARYTDPQENIVTTTVTEIPTQDFLDRLRPVAERNTWCGDLETTLTETLGLEFEPSLSDFCMCNLRDCVAVRQAALRDGKAKARLTLTDGSPRTVTPGQLGDLAIALQERGYLSYVEAAMAALPSTWVELPEMVHFRVTFELALYNDQATLKDVAAVSSRQWENVRMERV